MDHLQKIQEAHQWIRRLDGGTVPAATVVTHLIEPVEEWMLALTREGRWLTFAELMRKTGRSRNYFEHPAAADGKCRLQVWEDAGLAEQTEEGIWLVHPSVVDECGKATRLPKPATLDPEAIAARLAGD